MNLGGSVDGFMALNRLEQQFGCTLPPLVLTGDYVALIRSALRECDPGVGQTMAVNDLVGH
jgi:hypothetical protein